MVIVAGHIIVAPGDRATYLAGCESIVRAARAAAGCCDFTIGADLLDPGRINIFERWKSQDAVQSFRGNGPGDEQTAVVRSPAVAEYGVADVRPLS